MYSNGSGRHERELRDLLRENGRMIRSTGPREVWRLENGETIVVPSPTARVRDQHSWKNALAKLRRLLSGEKRANPTANARKPEFFQKILRSAGARSAAQISGAHVVIADEVAKLYERDGDRAWEPKDFPNIMPPFRKFFIEWRTDQSRGGILFTSCPIETDEEVRTVKAKEPRVAHLDLLGCWMSEADVFLNVGPNVVHAGTVLYFVDVDGTAKRIGERGFFLISPNQAVEELVNSSRELAESAAFGVIQERREHVTPFAAMMVSALNLGLLAISFMHSRSVSMPERELREGEVRRRMRRPGQRAEPVIRYRVLEIEPLRRILRTEGKSDEVGLRQALHTVRGHWRHYREKGLFGRDDLRGSFWIEEFRRGDPDHGTVIKDYEIGPIDPDAPTKNPMTDDERRQRDEQWRLEREAMEQLRDVPEGTPVEIVEKRGTKYDGSVWKAEFLYLHELPGMAWVRYREPVRLPSLKVEPVNVTEIRLIGRNPSVTCPGCGKGVKDTAARCWSCGLVFQRESGRPTFGRTARGSIGAATNPPSTGEQIRQVIHDLANAPNDPYLLERIRVLLNRLGDSDARCCYIEDLERLGIRL